MKNHTPRTQAVINRIADNPHNLQPLFDHARELERELSAAKERLLSEAADYYSSIKELQRELAAAKHDCGNAEKRCDVALASWDEERDRALRESARVLELRNALRIADAALGLAESQFGIEIPLINRARGSVKAAIGNSIRDTRGE